MKIIISTILIFIFVFITNAVYAISNKQQEINKTIVINFYNQAINNKDFKSASKYLGSKYIQHNPSAADGADGLKQYIQFLHVHYPYAHSEIKRIFADGDYVILQVYSIREPGTRGRAVFDLFKLKNEKIIEHWDTVQEIPEKSANTNGMI